MIGTLNKSEKIEKSCQTGKCFARPTVKVRKPLQPHVQHDLQLDCCVPVRVRNISEQIILNVSYPLYGMGYNTYFLDRFFIVF